MKRETHSRQFIACQRSPFSFLSAREYKDARGLIPIMDAQGKHMLSLRKRIKTLEKSQSLRRGAAREQIIRRVQGCVSDTDLDLLSSAVDALARGRELTPAECTATEAYVSAVARELGNL
jgi:hypothetical protein